jgi:GTP-binding protein
MRPIVAIVGRPNVGKSTLFNRLVGRRTALVDDRPGITRDRREADARLGDLSFRLIDTAGFEEGAAALSARTRAQTETAIAQAGAVLFLMDARTGVTPLDRSFADLLRKHAKPVILIANKSEGRLAEERAREAYELGLGDPLPVSAEHGDGLSDLRDAIAEALPETTEEGAADNEGRPIRVAIVGRPNVGKSTLINRLIGEERLITGPEAGITRDAIAVPFVHKGCTFEIYDSAGIRRRSRVVDKVEKLSVADALNAIRFAEVVVLLVDAAQPFEEQDLRIASLVAEEGRALVLGVNKWDLQTPKRGDVKRLRGEADHWLPQMKGVPVVTVSGLAGEGLDHLMAAVVEIRAVWERRVPTAGLNRFLSAAIEAFAPPAAAGRQIKLRYMTQAKARPPSFVLFGTRTGELPESYTRYLVNGLRERFDLPGVPVRLTLRETENPFAGRKKRKR